MNIHGFVVSVDYSAELAKALPLWMPGLSTLTVITDLKDEATVAVAAAHNATLFRTDAFTRNGATFNKGLAMAEAYAAASPQDWVLLFDADITPETEWALKLKWVQIGYLYGCNRIDDAGKKIKDDTHGYGFFQLFHSQDPIATGTPVFETCWQHGGNYDSAIMLRWRNAGRLAPALPIRLTHAGIGPSENWFGRGKVGEFRAMQQERRRRGGGWSSLEGERLGGNV